MPSRSLVVASALVALIVASSAILTLVGKFPPEWTRDIFFTVLGAILGSVATSARAYAVARRK